MTRRLILMRHAKSDWGSRTLSDHARPLNPRGRRAARAMGDWLRQQGLLPDTALVSTAMRTRETWTRLGLGGKVRFSDALYHAAPEDILGELRGAFGANVLILGHNPGIAEFAALLLAAPPAHPRFDDYPTCATLVADFEIRSWADLRPGTGRLVAFVTPRDIAPSPA